MATEKELKEVIDRVTAEVIQEIQGHEGAFKVADLYTQLKDLATVGGPVAWKITYDTSGDAVVSAKERVTLGGPVAWKITYDTSGDVIVKGKGQ